MRDSHRVLFLLVMAALFMFAWLRHGPPKKRSDGGYDGGNSGTNGGGSGGPLPLTHTDPSDYPEPATALSQGGSRQKRRSIDRCLD